ncbi:MAG: GDP-mannose 4,6-dehydratase [Thaumarchaeota archaeon]|nr:GDP-mannose 4,6-dehydratase [Nitrososphaerota archaeon]
MKVLVTGGAGFIGSHLVDALSAEGHRVTVVDDLSTGSTGNLAAHAKVAGFEFLKGDFAAGPSLSKAVRRADAVVHLAARVGVADSVRSPEAVHDVNVNRTLRLLRACAKGGVGRFVLASSASVYGDASPPVSEAMPLRPLSPYAASKASCEAYCQAYRASYGLPTVVLRFMNVYGPRMGGAYGAVMSEFAKSVEAGSPLTIYGDGRQTRDFLHVADAVRAIMLGATSERADGETFNIGTGTPTSISDLAELFIAASGRRDLKVSRVTPRPGEVRHSFADVAKAKRVLGFAAKIKLSNGVREYLKWRSQSGRPARE